MSAQFVGTYQATQVDASHADLGMQWVGILIHDMTAFEGDFPPNATATRPPDLPTSKAQVLFKSP